MACQIPLKLGFPSGVRGALYCVVVRVGGGACVVPAAGVVRVAGTACANDGDELNQNEHRLIVSITPILKAIFPAGTRIKRPPLCFVLRRRLGRFRRVGSPLPAGTGKEQNRFRLHLRGTTPVRILQDWPPDLHFVPNLEIQHVFVPLKPQRQWHRCLKRWRACCIGVFGSSPVRNAKFAVGAFRHTTKGNEVILPIHRLGVDRGSIRNTGNMHPLGGHPACPNALAAKQTSTPNELRTESVPFIRIPQ